MVIIHGTRRRERMLARQSRATLYTLNFLFTLHIALVSYYISTFLVERGFPQEFVGVLYAVGSIIMLAAIAYAPHLLRVYGNYTNLLVLGSIEFLVYIALSYITYLPGLFFLFIIGLVVPTLIAYSLDIFLEKSTEAGHTSGIRGVFLSIAAAAWILAPVLGGFLIERGGYTLLFTVAAAIFSPFILLAASRLHHFIDPQYKELSIKGIMRKLTRDIDLRNIFVIQFLFRMFYAIMFVYFPLYVHGTLGMPLSHIGIMIAVGSIAFLLIEIPLGKLQDAYWGEKEVLIVGSVVIGLSTIGFSFIASPSLWVWLPVLFCTRVGAAMLEVGSEGYFFKHTKTDSSDEVSAFRMLYPLSYIIGPVFGTVLLFFVPLQYVFTAMGAIMLLGVLAASALRDTK